jgi:hypothetical protein
VVGAGDQVEDVDPAPGRGEIGEDVPVGVVVRAPVAAAGGANVEEVHLEVAVDIPYGV